MKLTAKSTGTTAPSKSARGGTRNREKTKNELQLAILRVNNKARRLSIKAVAEEAGVDPSLIHNSYPDIAEQIRAAVGKGVRKQRDDKHQELLDAQKQNRELRDSVSKLSADLDEIASVNLTLADRVRTLEAELEGKVTRIRPSKK